MLLNTVLMLINTVLMLLNTVFDVNEYCFELNMPASSPQAHQQSIPSFQCPVPGTNGILLPKLFWPILKKKMFQWLRKTFEIKGWRQFCKIFEITRTIYSNSSERSGQFLVEECFFNLLLEVLMSIKSEQLEFKLETILGFRNMQEKLENICSLRPKNSSLVQNKQTRFNFLLVFCWSFRIAWIWLCSS